ncbi:hypothetical protein MMC26_006021 [Xylographa opegraphella]|nr:hypothetical protein [Xylographa opegraphella]
MTESEPGLEKDDSPNGEPPSAYVRGRRISLKAYTVSSAPEQATEASKPELDDFGLPVRTVSRGSRHNSIAEAPVQEDGEAEAETGRGIPSIFRRRSRLNQGNARSRSLATASENNEPIGDKNKDEEGDRGRLAFFRRRSTSAQTHERSQSLGESRRETSLPPTTKGVDSQPNGVNRSREQSGVRGRSRSNTLNQIPEHVAPVAVVGVSEWSHQALAPREVEVQEKKEDEWQDMPALGKYDLYDDEGNLVARGTADSDNEEDAYEGLGGAGKGYTRVQIDDDARSATSMDENTSYLFKENGTNVVDEDEEQRNPMAQMQATKEMLTEGQRIAYVGVTRLAMAQMVSALESMQTTKVHGKGIGHAIESMKKWSQKMMVRLFAHMEIDSSEQIMIEQLAEHGVQPSDLTPALMKNARVKNPMAADESASRPPVSSPNLNGLSGRSTRASSVSAQDSPPPYELHHNGELPEVRSPTTLASFKNIDIDVRWTVLCDLFLVLIADSIYDARSRVLLETVGAALDITWLDICRFEKRVTDALEMQEAAARETWDEAEHMESRRKLALKRKYMLMGLATVGGSLVIGLSAGLLAPVIGAGLAAGFTTIGVAGTSGFLAGAGGTALITTGAVLSGGTVAVRASNRRMGAVKTFEYRPLHNNKRVNLIVTVSGWMNGKVDDVRLPFSTVDPIMGDMYSLLWEPDMLQSMGDTIRILATEALTQGLQQVLASTILTALMASLTLPIVLTKLSYLIDNPWAVSLDRADAAGLILADSLVDRNLGVRPITLVGFSIGSRVIFSCLRELANKGAYGLVQNVYLFGSPIIAKKEDYIRARTVVSGRFVNGFASNDWILGYLFRATSGGISRIAGLASVEGIPGVENFNLTEFVNGHMAYRAAIPRLLREVGWEVESDEFTEIEDPDPDNHGARQRELIKEIEGARKEAEAKPEKRRFGIFKRGKLAEKKIWETYDEKSKQDSGASDDHDEKRRDSRVLFDIDAIRAELESEHMEVRQLESTLPPMRLDLNGSRAATDKIPQAPFSTLRATKSYDGTALSAHQPVDNETSDLSHEDGVPQHTFVNTPDSPNTSLQPDSQVTMSFEPQSPLPSAVLAWQSQSLASPDHPVTPQRPELRSSATMPATSNGAHLTHNAWADEDEEFGQEKEIHMSFE